MKTIGNHSVLRVLQFASAFVLLGVVATAPIQARPDFGVRGGAYTEEEEAFLGAEALFSVDDDRRWFGNPNIEHAFIDDGDLTTASFDFHYDFNNNQPYTVWAGAGPTVIFKDGDAFANDDDTDVGANLLVGVGAKKGEVRPYGQVKVILADDTEAVFGAGIRF